MSHEKFFGFALVFAAVMAIFINCGSGTAYTGSNNNGNSNSNGNGTYVCPENARCTTIENNYVAVYYYQPVTLNSIIESLPADKAIIRFNAVENGRSFMTALNQSYSDPSTIVLEYQTARDEIIGELLTQVTNMKERQTASQNADAGYINALQAEIDNLDLIKTSGADSSLLITTVILKGE